MSKEVKRWNELKALAEGMDGWPNKNAFEFDDAWCVGAIDEDENLWPVIEIQTEQYDAFDAAEPMAKYYAAANPPAILKLLAERDALLAERDAYKKALEKLATVPGCGCSFPCRCGGEEWTRAELEGRMDYAAETLDHAALQGEQP